MLPVMSLPNPHRRPLSLALIVVVLTLTALPAAAQVGQFVPTGSMSAPRSQHTATPLADGTVLVVGGQNDAGVLADGEIFQVGGSRALPAQVPALGRAAPQASPQSR